MGAPRIHPRGTVWGGIIKLPTHQHADMHGFLRAVVRHSYFSGVITCLERLGVHVLPQDLGRTWGSSYSAVEMEITRKLTGKVFAVSLTMQYLTPDAYARIRYPGEIENHRDDPEDLLEDIET